MAVIIRVLIPLVILIGILYILWEIHKTFLIPEAKKRDNLAAQRQADGAKAIEAYLGVRKAWLNYELDDEALLERPSMIDMKVPEVSFFHKELRRFEENYPDSYKLAKNAPVSDEFVRDAQLLVKALKDAERRSDELDKGN